MTHLKTEAFASAAHEFRNPLNGIAVSLDLLERKIENLSDDIFFKTAKNCSNIMLYLVKDILDFSQIEARSFLLNFSQVNMLSLFQECLGMFSMKVQEKGIDLILDYDTVSPSSLLPSELLIDGNRLKQIIINLLSNAIKYT